jgi:hypothetical protein
MHNGGTGRCERVQIKIISLENVDVITASGDIWLPEMP